MILFFSATGNSRHCARVLAEQLGDVCTDAAPFLRTGEGGRFASERPWVFVAPTYAWRLPRVFADFLRASRFSGSREACFVMTCGNDTGAAAARNRALCEELGLRCRGTAAVVMPENYIALFRAPGREEARAVVAAARPVLEEIAACIGEGRDLPEPRAGLADRLKSGPVNPLFYRFFVKARGFSASDACTSCGACVRNCPLDNVRLERGRPVWGDRCTHCMACICLCPAQAIEYGRATRGKVRYRCPEEDMPPPDQ